MDTKVFYFPVIIKEVYLDVFGHMNNAVYLTLFEEARWDFVTKNGFGLKKIMETGIGPTLLEVNLRFIKELRLRDEIVIESKIISYERKTGKIAQIMKRGDEICCSAEFTVGLFSLKERKLIAPTPEWLKALGIEG